MSQQYRVFMFGDSPLCFTGVRLAGKLPPKLGYLLFGMIFLGDSTMVNHEKQLG